MNGEEAKRKSEWIITIGGLTSDLNEYELAIPQFDHVHQQTVLMAECIEHHQTSSRRRASRDAVGTSSGLHRFCCACRNLKVKMHKNWIKIIWLRSSLLGCRRLNSSSLLWPYFVAKWHKLSSHPPRLSFFSTKCDEYSLPQWFCQSQLLPIAFRLPIKPISNSHTLSPLFSSKKHDEITRVIDTIRSGLLNIC